MKLTKQIMILDDNENIQRGIRNRSQQWTLPNILQHLETLNSWPSTLTSNWSAQHTLVMDRNRRWKGKTDSKGRKMGVNGEEGKETDKWGGVGRLIWLESSDRECKSEGGGGHQAIRPQKLNKKMIISMRHLPEGRNKEGESRSNTGQMRKKRE